MHKVVNWAMILLMVLDSSLTVVLENVYTHLSNSVVNFPCLAVPHQCSMGWDHPITFRGLSLFILPSRSEDFRKFPKKNWYPIKIFQKWFVPHKNFPKKIHTPWFFFRRTPGQISNLKGITDSVISFHQILQSVWPEFLSGNTGNIEN